MDTTQYVELNVSGVVTYLTTTRCTFRVTETKTARTGASGQSISDTTRTVTHFSNLNAQGVPVIPAVVLPTGTTARLGFFNKSGHFIPTTD